MELTSTDIVTSPTAHDRVRLVGKVAYDNKSFEPEDYWFEVPATHARFLSTSGNPWLVCLTPLAATLGEPLRISAPVDPVLYENVLELMHILKSWHPDLHLFSIEADVAEAGGDLAPARTALFFSAGVDSFFTALHHDSVAGAQGLGKIDDLVWVWGFDVRLQNAKGAEKRRATVREVVSDLGKGFVDVTTNLRDTGFRRARWAHVSHGCALGSVGLALEKRYSKVLISSTREYRVPGPWGSHPLTDPLLSSRRTRFVHYGAAFTRVEKTAFIVESDAAMRSLRVCYSDESGGNCGSCAKCYITMTALELLGALEGSNAFRKGSWQPERIANIFRDKDRRTYLREVRRLALEKGRRDIAQGVERCFRRSDLLLALLPIAKRLDDWLRTQPFLWRRVGPLEQLLLRDCIV